MIEKVARKRALEGRYGVDHSEVLNFEYEQANKERADHMNTLVYKAPVQEFSTAKQSAHRTKSNAIFERLTDKEMEAPQMDGLPYSEWLRRKDAEDRMKKKLIQEAKKDIRQEVF